MLQIDLIDLRLTMARKKQKSRPGWRRILDGAEGIDFVRCRICGDRRRVISGRHLSKHGIEHEAYMEEYGLSPDELIAKDFRRIRSSRPGFAPNGKKDWIAAIKKIYRRERNVGAGYLQDNYAYLYNQGVWIFGDWDKALLAAGFDPEEMRLKSPWDKKRVISGIRPCAIRNYRSTLIMSGSTARTCSTAL